ncbi:bifunctional diguanylate cyclase/phosphodiesterase [Solibacillus sp. FSL K6-1523]|uniref:bifunctional diguanylate cyclase/phosphodiesterase n=1 Tax=Solibacillus sp. FSL K6-1523 TaxID=2921471 RepID=UPI0030F5D6CF
MQKKGAKIPFYKQLVQFVLVSIILLAMLIFWSEGVYGVFIVDNYVTIHLLIEIFIIVVSLTIAIQSWLISPYILSSVRLCLGALFLTVGLLEMIHTLSYKGMPFFLTESMTYAPTWFYMISRLILPIGVIVILTVKEKTISASYRWIVYSISLLFSIGCVVLVYAQMPWLPSLVQEGSGPTVLKITLQYAAIFLQCIVLLFLMYYFKRAPRIMFYMICGSVYLIMSDVLYTTYNDVYDIKNFVGHILQLLASYLFFRAIYYSSIEEPFQQLTETQKHLKNSQEKMQFMAYHDDITNLPNERYLMENLKKRIYINDSQSAILAIEIDRFSTFKASLGKTCADQMLGMTAKRLQQILPGKYVLSILRDGSFILVIDDMKNTQYLMQLALQLQQIMKEPFDIQHFSLKGVLNIGIALYPVDAKNEEEFVMAAIYAMDEARKHPSRIKFYETTMSYGMAEKVILENDLHNALENDELFLEYQPQINIQTGEIVSVEALVRWQHPKKGWISPSVFIPVAEESGLIIPIGQWVLETACMQVKQWEQEGLPPLKIAVNLSIGQLFQQDLVEMVQKVLEKTALQPQYLQLEITESMTINIDHMSAVLQDLKKLGITIAVDDFGTGYSSLAYLKDFSIDCLKIDRSFMQKIQTNSTDEALVAMIISMAKHLQLKVVAEGIEEVEQLAYLKGSHCETVQGYLFSKPIQPKLLQENYGEIRDNAQRILKQLALIEA